MSVTKEQVLSALRAVQDPDLHKDIVSLGFVRQVTGRRAARSRCAIELTTPACPGQGRAEGARRSGPWRRVPGVDLGRARR